MGSNIMKHIQFVKTKNILGFGLEFGQFEVNLKKGINCVIAPNAEGKTRFLRLVETHFQSMLKLDWLRTNNEGAGNMELFLSDGTKSNIDIDEKQKAERSLFDSDGRELKKDTFLGD